METTTGHTLTVDAYRPMSSNGFVTVGGVSMTRAAAENLYAVCERSSLAAYVEADLAAARVDPEAFRSAVLDDVGEPEYAQGWADYASAIVAAVAP